MANTESVSEGSLWFQVGAEASLFRRRAKGPWQWIREPLVFTSILSTSYVNWWVLSTATLAVMAVGVCAGGASATIGSATWWLLLSTVGTWFLGYGLFLAAGERYFPRREVQLVLESAPEKPAGPNPVFITLYPAIAVAVLTLLSWFPLEPMNVVCAWLAVALGSALIIWGGSTYAVTPVWITVPAALVLPVLASAWAWDAAVANSGDQPVTREALSILAPMVTLAFLGIMHVQISAVRDANVRAWAELNNLLPKLATAATAGVLDAKYGPGQLVVDLKRVNTPVELIRPVCILIGTVIMRYRPWFHSVEGADAGAEPPEVPASLVNLTVMDQRGALRDPWKWFLPAPGRQQ